MSRLRALVVTQIRNNFSLARFWWRIRYGESRVRAAAIAVLLVVAMLPLLSAFVTAVKFMFSVLHTAGQESALIGLGVLAGQVLIFVVGLFYVISAFYFSNDLDLLIPLPVRPNEVILSKFFVVIINEYLVMMPFILPVFLGYGILARAPLSYWILLVPVYLLLPVIPLALSALLAIGLMRVVNLSRRKDALIVVGSLALMFLNVLVQMRAHHEGGPATIVRLLTERDGLIQVIGRNFPPCVWASRSLALGFSRGGALHFLALAGSSAAVLFGMVALSEKLFYQGAIGLSEIAAKRRALSRAEMETKISSGRHPLRAILQREIRIMNRTPVFLLNGVLVVFIIPAILLIGSSSGGPSPLRALSRAANSGHETTLILAIAALAIVCGSLSGTASSAFSREGKHFWMSKVLPVPWKQQVAAKFIHSYLVSFLGIIAGVIVSVVAVGAPLRILAPAVLLALVGTVPLNVAGLRIDLTRPQLKWTNPQQAIKQNLNVVLATIIDLSFIALCGFIAHYLMRAGLSGTLVYLVLLAIAAAAAWVTWRELATFAERKYPSIEA